MTPEQQVLIDVLTQLAIFSIGVSGLLLCWMWYLGTDKILVSYEQARRLRLERQTRRDLMKMQAHHRMPVTMRLMRRA